MKNLIKKLVIPLGLGLTSVHAEFLLEPGLNYTHVSLKGDRIFGGRNFGEMKYSYNAGALNLKLAYQMLPFLIGLDAQAISVGSLKAEEQENGSNTHSSATQTTLGILLGWHWSQDLRLRGSYYFSSNLNAGGGSGSSINRPSLEGSGFGLGIDLADVVPLVSLSATYKYMNYEREGTTNEFKGHELALGASFPIVF